MPINGIEQILIDSFDYKSMKKSLLRGVRKTVKLVPATNSIFQNRQRIHFDLPAISFWDVTNTNLLFFAKGTPLTTNTTLAFNNHMECVFNRVTWCTGNGSSIVEDLKQYNVDSASLFKYKISQDYANTISSLQQGYSDDILTRQGWCENGKQYSVNLLASGVMNSNLKYIPLGLLAKAGGFSRGLTLDLWTEDPQLCMVDSQNTTNKGYTLSDVYLQMEMIECPEYEEELYKKIKNGEMVMAIPFVSCNTDNNQLLGSQQGQVTMYIPSHENEYLTGVRSVFLQPRSDDVEYTYQFAKPQDLLGYQYIIKDRWFPTQQLDMGTNSYASQLNELLKYFNKNIKTYDRSITKGYQPNERNDPAVLSAQGVQLTLSDGDDTPVNLTSILLINQGYVVDSDSILVPGTGLYQISCTAIINPYSSGSAVDVGVGVKFCFNDTGSEVNTNAITILDRTGVTNAVGVFNETLISINFVAILLQGVKYSMNFVCTGSTSQARCTVLNPSITMSLLTPNSSEQFDPTQAQDFLLAQTFRTFYDNLDFLDRSGEFMLDGLNLAKDATPLTFKMTIGANPGSNTLSVIHFTDYIGAITIDKNSVNVIQ